MENILQKNKKEWATPQVWVLATSNEEDLINNGGASGQNEFLGPAGGGSVTKPGGSVYHS